MQHELPSFEFYEITEEPEAIEPLAKPLELEYPPYEEERFKPLSSSLGEIAVTQILEPPVAKVETPQQKELINQTNITEVTQIVETIYQDAEFIPEPLPQMEFKAGVPETYGTMGAFAVLLTILTFGLVPLQEEMV